MRRSARRADPGRSPPTARDTRRRRRRPNRRMPGRAVFQDLRRGRTRGPVRWWDPAWHTAARCARHRTVGAGASGREAVVEPEQRAVRTDAHTVAENDPASHGGVRVHSAVGPSRQLPGHVGVSSDVGVLAHTERIGKYRQPRTRSIAGRGLPPCRSGATGAQAVDLREDPVSAHSRTDRSVVGGAVTWHTSGCRNRVGRSLRWRNRSHHRRLRGGPSPPSG